MVAGEQLSIRPALRLSAGGDGMVVVEGRLALQHCHILSGARVVGFARLP